MSNDTQRGGTGESASALRARLRPERSLEQDTQRFHSGEAWEAFCERLKAIGPELQRGAAGQPESVQAEGVPYLLGLVASGIQHATQVSDPLAPRFLRNPDSQAKWGAENADNHYLWARVDPAHTYRIVCDRRNAYEILFEAKDGYMQLGDERSFATRSMQDIAVSTDGTFEVIVSATPHDGNWLPLAEDAHYLNVRQYLVDWEVERPATFHIERVGAEGRPPSPLSAANAARMLDFAAEWAVQSARFWNEWVDQLRDAYRPNEIAPAVHFAGGPDDIFYGNDWYRLAEDEALIFECSPPDARYWAVQLCSPWFVTLDYAARQTSLNHHQTRLDADGRMRVVIAHGDPGVPNWLDTAGHPEGMIQYRWIWARDNPTPSVRIVKQDAIRAALPEETPRVDPERRRRAIHTRQRHLSRREPVS
jgi:hypothetical protein